MVRIGGSEALLGTAAAGLRFGALGYRASGGR